MKKHIESATEAFGTLLTALVALFIAAKSEGAPAETPAKPEKPAKAGGKGGKPAPVEPEEEENDDDLLGGGDEEEEEVVITMEQLRAAGQAAIKAGKSDKMKAILKKHGSENLGGLKKEDYPAVHAALSKLS